MENKVTPIPLNLVFVQKRRLFYHEKDVKRSKLINYLFCNKIWKANWTFFLFIALQKFIKQKKIAHIQFTAQWQRLFVLPYGRWFESLYECFYSYVRLSKKCSLFYPHFALSTERGHKRQGAVSNQMSNFDFHYKTIPYVKCSQLASVSLKLRSFPKSPIFNKP